MSRPPRTYQTIWETIKKSHPKDTRISAHSSLHPRIIKAVRKEKDKDLAYKLELADVEMKAVLTQKCEASIITFTLVKKGFDLKDL